MTPGFVAAILEGFEGTLDVVLDRVVDGELRREIEALQEHIAGQRRTLEEQEAVELSPLECVCLSSVEVREDCSELNDRTGRYRPALTFPKRSESK